MLRSVSLYLLSFTLFVSCSNKNTSEFRLDHEKFTLDNGMDVILHKDSSDPIVAVSILVHVGSNREKPGRTGFAHFFEHMLFQVSENLEEGTFFKKINDLGGTFNGGTWNDGTIYFEVVPKDALEKILWMESDRMGFFINAVTEKQLEDEKPVVKNEKRQRVDNQPYGHTNEMVIKNLYPKGHPYSWTVIGELEDLQNAELKDVKEFYNRYYGPNNATLVIAGDIDFAETKKLIEKYFAEIKAKEKTEPLKVNVPVLSESKRLYYEDSYARLPRLRITFPSVDQNNNDQFALNALASLLTQGKAASLYKSVVEEKKLAPNVNASNNSLELAGTFDITITANADTKLDELRETVFESLNRFNSNSFSDEELERVKISQESAFYTSQNPFTGIASVLGKAVQLSFGNTFSKKPDQIIDNINAIKSLTKSDIMRVFNRYIKDKKHITSSVVPKGKKDLIVSNSKEYKIAEEDITKNRGKKSVDSSNIVIKKTDSKIDRTIEPPLGELPLVKSPKIWTKEYENGLKAYGTESFELPTFQFSIRLRGGQLFDTQEKAGVANLITDMMMEGTKNKSPKELEDAIKQIGATINMFTSREHITITGSALSRYYTELMDLVEEMILEPRWDEKEFARLKKEKITQISAMEANPNAVARNASNKLLYGEENILSYPIIGIKSSVERIELSDLKAYYEKAFSPSIANYHFAGAVKQADVEKRLEKFVQNWKAKKVTIPSYSVDASKKPTAVYFVDIPNSKQSVFRINMMQKNDSQELFTKLNAVNNRLGAGSGGQLFQVLREDSGFTYGAYSFFQRNSEARVFTALASIKSNKTLAAAKTFRSVIRNYKKNYSQEDLDKTKNQLIKQNTRRFETLANVMTVMQNISDYNLPLNYIERDQEIITKLDLDETKSLMDKYINFNQMSYLLVGDAKTQMPALKKLGYGKAILLDRYGNKVGKYKGKDASSRTIKVKK